MADKTVMRQDVKQQVVNPPIAKWDHLKDNQYCNHYVATNLVSWNHTITGFLHRVDESGVQDGPATIYDGNQAWWLDGKRHRLDGHAYIWDNGDQLWFLDGNRVTKEEWARDPRVIEYHSRTQEGAESWLLCM